MTTTLQNELRANRARKSLTQTDVADHLGVTKQTVMCWERGKHALTYEQAWKLADLYGVTLDELGGRNYEP